ncbi:uncharacterized protein LOC131619537 [Vicia villosa]|uniref:uncharacterized protein LOC131619537 n=1 Tax=Vicia villosa TaxID=3911 RepID=UPI00273AE1B9|nr:uncharacterized protein LOC131619537 [Vicia villosa]
MKILSWNCRGLGNPRAVRALSRLIKLENPSLVFLMETKLKLDEMQKVSSKLGYKFSQTVECRGSGYCQLEDEEGPWSFLGFYGFPDELRKRDSWLLLEGVFRELEGKFLAFGDFNDTVQESEKRGGNCRSSSQMAWGRQSLANCNLIDVGFWGYSFTWTNGRQGSDNIQCRLDRIIANNSFMDYLLLSKVVHHPRFGSDHVVLRIVVEKETFVEKKRHLFRFEDVWLREPSCERLVRQLWSEATGFISHRTKAIQALQDVFKGLRTGNIAKELKRVELLL